MFKRIRDIAAASIFGFVTMCSPALFQAAHADLKGIELTSDTPLPMYHVSSSTLNLQSNTTLQGIPDLTQDLVAGNVYTCHAHLVGSSDTSTTIGGIKVSLAATNGLTASPVESSTIVYNSTAAVANNAASSLGNMVSFTGRYTDIILDASFSATHSGTIQLQAAQVASDVTITSVGQGSTFNCIHTPGTIAQVIQQGTPPMSAPFSGGASPNGNNYATGCNNGSCLAAEDVFQATTLSTAWNPYFASGATAGGSTSSQNFVMAAPITPNATNSSNLRYNDGCTGSPGAASSNFANHSCLMFDDHWTTTPTGTTPITALNLNNWYAGMMRCNSGTGGNANCLEQAIGSVNYPWTSWCYGDIGGCQATIYLDYPLGYPANNFGITHNPLTIASDGSLQMQQKFYSNGTAVADSSCVPLGGPNTDCTKINWIGATITSGGLATPGGDNNLPTNLTALIPTSGGMMQYRMKQDIGLNSGAWGGFECDAVNPFNGINPQPNLNANMEFGYTNGGATTGVQGFGMGLNSLDNQATNAVITTGDDGVGSGDARNWHTYALEWTGNATHSWNWYIDGVPQPVGGTQHTHVEPNIPDAGFGFTCTLTQMTALPNETFHSQFNISSPVSPMNVWISDFQVYKRPGT